ncbi:MAG: PAS domain-containing sensor histidine kinase [Candidatus Thorarchaeota archaeon]|nr:PAS domain-containing sensor histidine kinase [Candidatus Thorarchaeota archaeon]
MNHHTREASPDSRLTSDESRGGLAVVNSDTLNPPLLQAALRSILRQVPCGVAILDATGRFSYYNKHFIKIMKLTRKYVEQVNIGAPLRSKKMLIIKNAYILAKNRRSSEPSLIEIPLKRTRLRFVTRALFAEQEFLGFILVEDQRSMRTLDLATFIKNAATNALVIHTVQGIITQCNSSLISSLGYHTVHIIGKPIYELEYDVNEASFKERVEKLKIKRVLQFTTKYRSWDGIIVPAKVRSIILEDGGAGYIVNLIEFDQKALGKVSVHSLDQYSHIFESIPVAALLWSQLDSKYILISYNDAADIVTGGRIRAFIGKTARDIFEGMPEVEAALDEALLSGGVIRGEIPCHCTAIGLNGIFLLSFSRVMGRSIIMTITDVTKHVNMQKKLNKQTEELSAFAHEMSHDIKGLLHNLMLTLELLEEEVRHQRIDDIRNIVAHIDQMLTESILLAEAGETIGHFQCCDLNQVIDSIVHMIAPSTVSVSVSSLPMVRCDNHKVIQMFLNIIRNAIEHGKATKIEIECVKDEKYYNIIFRNNGLPIPPKIRKTLFRKRVSSKPHGGRGLLIVRRLVDAHGWGIDLVPTENPAFRIKIPLDYECTVQDCAER